MPDRVKAIIRDFCDDAEFRRLMASKKRSDCPMKWAIWSEVRNTIVMANGLPPSYPQMGEWFGVHHTTIMGGVKGIEVVKSKKTVKPLTEEEMATAVKMRLAGKSFVEIGRDIHRDPRAVSMSLREAGHDRMNTTWTDDMDEIVRSMWSEDARGSDIAEKLGNGVTASAVSNRITRLGLQGRKRGRYRKSEEKRKRQATPRNVFPRENGSWDSRTYLPWPLWKIWKQEQRRAERAERV